MTATIILYRVRATCLQGDVRVDASTPEVLGDLHAARWTSESAAERAADEADSEIEDRPDIEGVEYAVEAVTVDVEMRADAPVFGDEVSLDVDCDGVMVTVGVPPALHETAKAARNVDAYLDCWAPNEDPTVWIGRRSWAAGVVDADLLPALLRDGALRVRAAWLARPTAIVLADRYGNDGTT